MIQPNEWPIRPAKSPNALVSQRVLGWTDPETGERLMVRMHGSERFLQALQPLGFELVEDELGHTRGESRISVDPEPSRAWVSVKAHLNPEREAR